jgi:hypothetical protein
MTREAAVVQPRRGNIFVETVANERGKLRQERHRNECGDMSPPTGLEICWDWAFYKDSAPDGANGAPSISFSTQPLKAELHTET